MNLDDLFIKYGTDKGGPWGWGYAEYYQHALGPKRFDVKRVLEIGICGNRDIPNNITGASLWAWSDFFPNAEIIGLDNNSAWMVNEGRIRSFCVDAYDRPALLEVMKKLGPEPFDLIVDDAVHDPLPQLNLLQTLLPYLAPTGLYAMEDVCPYKLPEGKPESVIDCFRQPGHETQVFTTHKPEVLVFIKPSLGVR